MRARNTDDGFSQYNTRAPAWAKANAIRSGTFDASHVHPEMTIASRNFIRPQSREGRVNLLE